MGRNRTQYVCGNCEKPAIALGLCRLHYNRLRRQLGVGRRVKVEPCFDGLPHAWANGVCRLCKCDRPRERWTTREE